MHPSIHPSHSFFHPCIHPSIHLSSVHPSIFHSFFHPCSHPSIFYLFMHQCIHPSLINSFIPKSIHLSSIFIHIRPYPSILIRINEKEPLASSLSIHGNNNYVHVQGACRSLVRNSKSEDQLAVSESLEDDDEYLGQSCHTLLSSAEPQQHQLPGSAPRPVRQESSDSSSSQSKGSSSADHLVSQVGSSRW